MTHSLGMTHLLGMTHSLAMIHSLGMTPFWIWLLGPVVTGSDTDITIPVENVLLSLLLIILPVIPGLLLGKASFYSRQIKNNSLIFHSNIRLLFRLENEEC